MKVYPLLKAGLIPIFAVLMATQVVRAQAPNYPTDYKQAQIIHSDLANFSEAFDMLSTESDTLKVLNSIYFEKASIGLKEFINRHQLTAELLRDAIRINPETYSRIKGFMLQMEKFELSYQETLATFGRTVPNTMFAPTYLLVGANRGIAQASQYGQLVTIGKLMGDTDKLLTFIVHELVHFQQAKELGGQQYVAVYSKPNNMLDLCLREGGAEFITQLVLNRITQKRALKYLLEHEKELKIKYKEDLKNQDATYWLWESLNQNEYPKLLGYAMGYQICKSYYEHSPDKREAIKQILAIKDAHVFVESSSYY
jgi:hypothetical protein